MTGIFRIGHGSQRASSGNAGAHRRLFPGCIPAALASAWAALSLDGDAAIVSQVWPSRLPNPTMDGYELQPQDPTVRSEMEVGPARVRRVATAMPTHVPVGWELNAEEMAGFEAWWRYAIHQGADWFNVTLANGQGLVPVTSRFIGPYRAAVQSGLNWRVTATLEVESMPVMAEADLAEWLNA